MGETSITFTRDNQQLNFEGLVVEHLDVEIFAGTPFMEVNDIAVRPAQRQVIIRNGPPYQYGSSGKQPAEKAVRRAVVLRSPPISTTVWPGEFLEVELPHDVPTDTEYALEPRTNAPSARSAKISKLWPPPNIVSSVAGKIRIPNLSDQPHILQRNEHFCQVSPVFVPQKSQQSPGTPTSPLKAQASPRPCTHSSNVSLDPANLLPPNISSKF